MTPELTLVETLASAPATPALGSEARGICGKCEEPFTWLWKGMPRRFCDSCVAKASAESVKRHHKKLKLRPGETPGKSLAGLYRIALCSQEEAAVRLAVWEEFERLAKAGASWSEFEKLENDETAVKLHPLTEQAVQQLERRAIIKIRRALEKDYLEMKGEERGGETNR